MQELMVQKKTSMAQDIQQSVIQQIFTQFKRQQLQHPTCC